MKTHALKVWPAYFDAIDTGRKTFELRKNDRNFAMGDKLLLREFVPMKQALVTPQNPDPPRQGFTGRSIERVVIYVLESGMRFGLQEGYVILGLQPALLALGAQMLGGDLFVRTDDPAFAVMVHNQLMGVTDLFTRLSKTKTPDEAWSVLEAERSKSKKKPDEVDS